jgi:hypothetical protein
MESVKYYKITKFMKTFKNPWKSMKINEMIENYELYFWGRLPVSGTFAGEWDVCR